jgi:ABC-2 type transport system ATP-binding protein
MLKRLALTPVLLGDATIAVLDEPTSGLDLDGLRLLRDVVARKANAGAAVLVSSHDLDEMEGVCHRFVLLRDGRVLEDADSNELLNTGVTEFRFIDGGDGACELLHARGIPANSMPATRGCTIEVQRRSAKRALRTLVEARIVPDEVVARRHKLEDIVFQSFTDGMT